MLGLGKWQGSVKTIFFKGDVIIEIEEDDGEYEIEVKLPKPFEEAEFEFHNLVEEGNVLKGEGSISLLPGRKLEAELTFDGDAMQGTLKIPFIGVIKIKDGKRIG